MKLRFPALLAILIIMTATAAAGCTLPTASPAASVLPTATARPTATIAPAPAIVTAMPTGSGTAPITLFEAGKFSWFEYRTTENGMEVDTKTVVSTAAYGGISDARRLTSTRTTGSGDQAIVSDSTLYYDPGSDRFLGGHVKAAMGGTVLYDKDIAAGDSAYANSDYIGQSTAAAPVYLGNEPISVPRASYPTSAKYTVTGDGKTVTYWIAPGVPVPIQISISPIDPSTTMQLVDYG